MSALPEALPIDRIGGEPVVRQIVARFYESMDADPAFARLRGMHAGDLGPMRDKLGDFLVGWLGGPPLYFRRSDARCMGSAHASFPIDEAVRQQWLVCMRRAIDDAGVAPEIRTMIDEALGRMTAAMKNR